MNVAITLNSSLVLHTLVWTCIHNGLAATIYGYCYYTTQASAAVSNNNARLGRAAGGGPVCREGAPLLFVRHAHRRGVGGFETRSSERAANATATWPVTRVRNARDIRHELKHSKLILHHVLRRFALKNCRFRYFFQKSPAHSL